MFLRRACYIFIITISICQIIDGVKCHGNATKGLSTNRKKTTKPKEKQGVIGDSGAEIFKPNPIKSHGKVKFFSRKKPSKTKTGTTRHLVDYQAGPRSRTDDQGYDNAPVAEQSLPTIPAKKQPQLRKPDFVNAKEEILATAQELGLNDAVEALGTVGQVGDSRDPMPTNIREKPHGVTEVHEKGESRGGPYYDVDSGGPGILTAQQLRKHHMRENEIISNAGIYGGYLGGAPPTSKMDPHYPTTSIMTMSRPTVRSIKEEASKTVENDFEDKVDFDKEVQIYKQRAIELKQNAVTNATSVDGSQPTEQSETTTAAPPQPTSIATTPSPMTTESTPITTDAFTTSTVQTTASTAIIETTPVPVPQVTNAQTTPTQPPLTVSSTSPPINNQTAGAPTSEDESDNQTMTEFKFTKINQTSLPSAAEVVQTAPASPLPTPKEQAVIEKNIEEINNKSIPDTGQDANPNVVSLDCRNSVTNVTQTTCADLLLNRKLSIMNETLASHSIPDQTNDTQPIQSTSAEARGQRPPEPITAGQQILRQRQIDVKHDTQVMQYPNIAHGMPYPHTEMNLEHEGMQKSNMNPGNEAPQHLQIDYEHATQIHQNTNHQTPQQLTTNIESQRTPPEQFIIEPQNSFQNQRDHGGYRNNQELMQEGSFEGINARNKPAMQENTRFANQATQSNPQRPEVKPSSMGNGEENKEFNQPLFSSDDKNSDHHANNNNNKQHSNSDIDQYSVVNDDDLPGQAEQNRFLDALAGGADLPHEDTSYMRAAHQQSQLMEHDEGIVHLDLQGAKTDIQSQNEQGHGGVVSWGATLDIKKPKHEVFGKIGLKKVSAQKSNTPNQVPVAASTLIPEESRQETGSREKTSNKGNVAGSNVPAKQPIKPVEPIAKELVNKDPLMISRTNSSSGEWEVSVSLVSNNETASKTGDTRSGFKQIAGNITGGGSQVGLASILVAGKVGENIVTNSTRLYADPYQSFKRWLDKMR